LVVRHEFVNNLSKSQISMLDFRACLMSILDSEKIIGHKK